MINNILLREFKIYNDKWQFEVNVDDTIIFSFDIIFDSTEDSFTLLSELLFNCDVHKNLKFFNNNFKFVLNDIIESKLNNDDIFFEDSEFKLLFYNLQFLKLLVENKEIVLWK